MKKDCDIAILGGGPGGYVAALKGAQLKKKVILIEREKVGGTCMNWGCIPTKYLLHQTRIFQDLKENKNIKGPLGKLSLDWEKLKKEKKIVVERLVRGVELLLKKNGVEIVKGEGILRNEKQIEVKEEGSKKVIESDNILLATGSCPLELPFLRPNGEEVITSREALELDRIPSRLLIIGAGAIGLEIGTIFQRLGSEVTILEIMPTILPGSEREIIIKMERMLKRQGLKIYTQMRIEGSQKQGKIVCLKGTCLTDQTPFELDAEKILLAAGRRPNSESFMKKETGLSLDQRGFVKANARLETNLPGVYAIGDVIGGKLLAHKASHEGIIAVENIAGLKRTMNYHALPIGVFTEPEFSSVGYTEKEAREKGLRIQVGIFSLQANGRAVTMGRSEGAVKIIADAKDKIIGAHILAPNASELIAELTLAVMKGMKLSEVETSVHIHPTLSEAVMEAAMRAKNRCLHMLNEKSL